MDHVASAVAVRTADQDRRRPSMDAISCRPTAAQAVSTTFYRRGEPMRIRAGLGECSGRIVHGAARLCVLQNADHRRIIDFLLPGDLLDSAACGPGFDLEAVCDGTAMAVYSKKAAQGWAAANPHGPDEAPDLSLAMAVRFRRQIMILGRSFAMGKLCAFLLEMQERCVSNQQATIVLPMSRYDIADYLAISVETVSRCLTALQARKAIALIRRREIKILDRGALECGLAGS